MRNIEKEILQKAISHNVGLLSPVDMINGIAKRDRKSVENLVVRGYLEEVPVDKTGLQGNTYTLQFYRVTEKGLNVFEPWYKKLWFMMKGDVRTIIISVITAVVSTIAILLINQLFKK